MADVLIETTDEEEIIDISKETLDYLWELNASLQRSGN